MTDEKTSNGAAHATDTRPPFDPDDRTKVRHLKVGVWDFYQEIVPRFRLSDLVALDYLTQLKNSVPHLLSLFRDVLAMPGCVALLLLYFTVSVVSSLLPALQLWYSSEILNLIQSALETRAFDATVLRQSVVGGVGCAIGTQVLQIIRRWIESPLQHKIMAHFTWLTLRARLHLDCPTFEDEAIQRQFDSVPEHSIGWQSLSSVISSVTTTTDAVSQCLVLFSFIRQQPSMLIFAILHALTPLFGSRGSYSTLHTTTWAATTRDNDFITMEGIKEMAREKKHRKEIVAGNLQNHLSQQWFQSMLKFGGVPGSWFYSAWEQYQAKQFKFFDFLLSICRSCAEFVLLYQAIKMPATLPSSYASLLLVRQAITDLSSKIYMLQHTARSLTEELSNIKQLYNLPTLPRAIDDGKTPFPENSAELASGMHIEFRNVSFQYPRTETYALQNVSFKLERGQLCVIVGSNGSGKSTLLKLLMRIYDPTEGVILINGLDIKNLRIADVRSAVSVLFQDYSIFPLSVRQNIALGDPTHADDNHRIEQAAELAGATEVIQKLPHKFDSYVSRPVHDQFSRLPEGTYSLFGAKDLKVYGQHGWSREEHELSGGESQRLALARSFMRYLGDDEKVSMLVFDEPSAALDPEAEYTMFERLRKLRGSKTMIFSSHRFGNLTRHADLILYMKEAKVVESGNHASLVRLGGGYASMYKIQADAFREDGA